MTSFALRRSARARLTATVGAALLAASMALVWPGAAASAAAAPPTACSDTSATESDASAMADRCATQVEVLSARTETQQVFANPGGSFTRSTAIVPERVHKSDGSWAPIDLTLQSRPDGTVAPASSVADVSFSGGGTGPMVTWRKDGHTFTLTWPGALPAPVLSGDSATYLSILPDVDLVVTATNGGFKHVLVVHTAAAAVDSRIRALHFTVGGDATVKTNADGGLTASAGTTTFANAAAPFMWDAAAATPGATRVAGARPLDVDPVGDRSSERVIAPLAKRWNLATSMVGKDLVLGQPASLDGMALPLYIDPDWTPSAVGYSDTDNSNWSVVDNTQQSGEPANQAQIWLGPDPSIAHSFRSYLKFAMTGLSGKHILLAHLTGVLDHSYPCTAGTDAHMYLYRTTQTVNGGRITWSTAIPGGVLLLNYNPTSAHENADTSNCPKPNVGLDMGVTGDVTSQVAAGATTYTVALSAASAASGTGETTTQNRWKRINQSGLHFQIDYNSKPTVTSTSTTPATPCVAGGSGPDPTRPFVNTSPTLNAVIGDADTESDLQMQVEYQQWTGSAWGTTNTASQTALTQNSTGHVNTALADGVYQWRVYAADPYPGRSGYYSAGTDTSAATGWCQFEVDTTDPVNPSISSSDFPANCVCGSPGQSGTLNLSSSSDTASFLWGTTNPPSTPVNGTTASVRWMPTEGGPQNIYVQAIDHAGNASGVLTYPVFINPPSANTGRWLQLDDLGNLNLADSSGGSTTHDMTLTGAADTAAAARVPGEVSLGLSGTVAAPQYAASASQVMATNSQDWTASAWVKVTTAPTASNFETVLSQSAGSFSSFEMQARPAGWCVNTSPSSGTDHAFCGGTVNVGVWTQVAVQSDLFNGRMRVYVNGVKVADGASVPPVGSSGPMMIGATKVSSAISGVLQGSVSDVRVWQRALSDNEIASLMVLPVVGKYRFGELDPPETDESGHFHDLFFGDGVSVPLPSQGYDGTGLVTDGTGSASSNEQVVHTDQSFTVAVWANPSSLANSGVVVSQDGVNQSGFVLKYSKHFNKWRFGVAPSDDASALTDDSRDSTWPGAQSTVTPAVGRWDYLVGTYDATNKQLKLYVNGALQSTVSSVTNWDATGVLRVGQDMAGTGFVGAIDELRIYAGVMPTWLGDWRFDAGACTGTPVVCTDSATPGHPVTLAGGASQGASGKDGSGLHITGNAGTVSGAASTSGPLLDNTKSFTVSAWVNMAAIAGGAETVVSQPGVNKSGFELGYQSALFAPRNTWCFTMFGSDSTSASSVKACSGSDAVAGTWVHLVGIYDATAGTITLHINGGAANGGETVTASDNQTFLATGALAIGRAGTVSSPAAGFVGDIDNVRIYQGVVTDPTLLM